VAKSKSSPSAKSNSNATAKRKASPASTDGQSTTAKKATVDAAPAISNEQIGHVAGELWRLLDKEGAQNLAAIKKATGASNELVLAAIGWLAREDKLDFTASGRSVKVSLR
jgi:hypothetical protein